MQHHLRGLTGTLYLHKENSLNKTYKLQSNANDRRYMAEILPIRRETNADDSGLKILVKKTEAMSMNTNHPQRIQLYGKDMTNSGSFTCNN